MPVEGITACTGVMRRTKAIGLSLVALVIAGFVALRAGEPLTDYAIAATERIAVPVGFVLQDEVDVQMLRRFPAQPLASMDDGRRSLDGSEWFRLRLVRPASGTPEGRWLYLHADHQREIEAVLVVDGRIQARASAGFHRNQSDRAPLEIDLELPLANWRTGTAEVIIRASSAEQMLFLPRIMRESEMRRETRIALVLQTAFFGGAVTLTFFQFLLFLYLREHTSRDYALFALGLLLGTLAQWGYFDHLFHGRFGFYLGDLRAELKLLNTWLGLRCLFGYFDLSRRVPWTRVLPLVINLTVVAALILGLEMSATRHHALAAVLQTLACMGAIVICGWSVRARLPGAVLNAIGWGGLLGGALWANFLQLGLLAPPRFAYLIPTAAVGWQMVWNTLLVTHRFRKIREAAHEAELTRLKAERAERALAVSERANAEFARAARVKDEFMANMSHELRTPLNALLGNASMLQEQLLGPLTPKQAEMVRAMEESGRHLLGLVNDVLDATRLEAGQLRITRRRVDVARVVNRGFDLVNSAAQRKRIALTAQVPADLPALYADERRVTQMLHVLLSNGVKFTPVGGSVGVTVRATQEGRAITFEVRDTGIGISPEDQLRLFRPFVQLDSGLARRFEGSGLGLSLVRGLAQLHGGNVSVQSAVGRGSRFCFELPLGEADESQTEDVAV